MPQEPARLPWPSASWSDVVHLLIHLVRGLNNFRVRLVAALADNHIDELFDDVHVGTFHIALHQRSQAFLAAWIPDSRIAGCVRGHEQILSNAIESGGICKVG